MDYERLRQISKSLLGNRYRLEIASEIGQLDVDIFHAKEIADNLALPHNVVSEQIKSFVDVGLCHDVPAVSGQRHRFFRRSESCFWSGCEALRNEVAIFDRETSENFHRGR